MRHPAACLLLFEQYSLSVSVTERSILRATNLRIIVSTLFFSFLSKASLLLIAALAATGATAQDVHVYVSPSFTPTPQNDKFPTIQMALDHAPEPGPDGRLYLHIAPGTYPQRIIVMPIRPRTTFLGMGSDPSKVVITAAQNAKSAGGTFFTETVEINAPDFQADNVTFENTAGPTGQAVALSINADRAIIKHCRILGDQDTLFANYGRQYYLDTYISGGVDFIFGNATAFFERNEIHIIRPGYLTAQSRTSLTQTTGYVFDHAKITSSDTSGKPFFLGRPWRGYSRVIFLNSEMPENLSPAGWSEWAGNANPANTFYAERGSTGPGARPSSRVPWSHQLSEKDAKQFQATTFLAGSDHWNGPAEAARLP